MIEAQQTQQNIGNNKDETINVYLYDINVFIFTQSYLLLDN